MSRRRGVGDALRRSLILAEARAHRGRRRPVSSALHGRWHEACEQQREERGPGADAAARPRTTSTALRPPRRHHLRTIQSPSLDPPANLPSRLSHRGSLEKAFERPRRACTPFLQTNRGSPSPDDEPRDARGEKQCGARGRFLERLAGREVLSRGERRCRARRNAPCLVESRRATPPLTVNSKRDAGFFCRSTLWRSGDSEKNSIVDLMHLSFWRQFSAARTLSRPHITDRTGDRACTGTRATTPRWSPRARVSLGR